MELFCRALLQDNYIASNIYHIIAFPMKFFGQGHFHKAIIKLIAINVSYHYLWSSSASHHNKAIISPIAVNTSYHYLWSSSARAPLRSNYINSSINLIISYPMKLVFKGTTIISPQAFIISMHTQWNYFTRAPLQGNHTKSCINHIISYPKKLFSKGTTLGQSFHI